MAGYICVVIANAGEAKLIKASKSIINLKISLLILENNLQPIPAGTSSRHFALSSLYIYTVHCTLLLTQLSTYSHYNSNALN